MKVIFTVASSMTDLVFPANGRKHLQTACQTSLAI